MKFTVNSRTMLRFNLLGYEWMSVIESYGTMNKHLLVTAFSASVLLASGCTTMETTLAPVPEKVRMPIKPSLSERTYILEYQYAHQTPRVKSVQLPAHPITRGQSVVIESEQVALTERLRNRLVAILNDKQLTVISDRKQADYVLSINQLDISETESIEYQLANATVFGESDLAQQFTTKQCSNILGSVSMKLSHQSSQDVVWFAKSSIDTASFQRNPLRYKLVMSDHIENLEQVQQFVNTHNAPDAMQKRGAQPAPQAPQYIVRTKSSGLSKIAGACEQAEVSALVPDLHYYLSGILLEKINVN